MKGEGGIEANLIQFFFVFSSNTKRHKMDRISNESYQKVALV